MKEEKYKGKNREQEEEAKIYFLYSKQWLIFLIRGNTESGIFTGNSETLECLHFTHIQDRNTINPLKTMLV
jgi:hypothetical protein